MELSRARIIEIAKETIGQRNNPKWQEYRKNRVTGSLFGKALSKMRNSNKPFDVYSGANLRGQILQTRPFETNTAMKWGIDHEADAIEKYQFLTGNKVEDTGIWLFPDGILAASPDGLVVDPKHPGKYLGIIEVKCPFKLHWDPIENEKDWHFYLNYLDDENNLNREHDYYHQIQGQLVATDLPWCDFIIWSPSKTHIQRIDRDENWKPNIRILLDFYKSYIICRSEDGWVKEWSPPSSEAPTIDLTKLFENRKANLYWGIQSSVEKMFTESVAYHLARWVNKFHIAEPAPKVWTDLCERHLEKATEHLCKTCISKLLMEQWGMKARVLDSETDYEAILNSNWDIPTYILENAGKKLPNLLTMSNVFGEPCLCLKY